MLVLHSSSTCDVCLDSYGEDKVPHTISCGHSFCLRCLQLLTRQCCPLCRKPFVPEEVRRLHTGKASRSATPPPSDPALAAEAASRAQRLLRRITRIVLEGATSEDLQDAIGETHSWLLTQPESAHPDLRSAYLLLYKYTALQRKAEEKKNALSNLENTCDDLREQLQAQAQDAENRLQELDKLRNEELEAARIMKESLHERYDKLDKEWCGKFEVCLSECRRLHKELEDLKQAQYNPLPHPPRAAEARYFYLKTTSSHHEPVIVVKGDGLDTLESVKVQITGKDDAFRLSPVPPTLAIPALPTAFRPLTDDVDDRDIDEVPARRQCDNSSLRAPQPIPIKSSIQRMASNASLLSRHDDPMGRSIPHGSVDVHMASCSSSPSVTTMHAAARDRLKDGISGSPAVVSESALGLRSAGSRRPSIGSQTSSFDQEEQGLRWRAQLRELLNDPSPSPARPEARDLKQSLTFDSPSCAPEMTPAPVIPPLPTSTASACLARSSTISRASTAAMAAERARAAAMNNGSPTSPSTPSSKNRDAAQPLSPGSQPPYSRPAYTRMESSESLRSKTSATTTSGLTWSLRMHEQRA